MRSMETFIAEHLTDATPPSLAGLTVGQVIKWQNDYGVQWENRIIGFSADEFYMDTDAYWSGFKLNVVLAIDGRPYQSLPDPRADILLGNGEIAKFTHFDFWSRPHYILENGTEVCCIDLDGSNLHTMTTDGEPLCPVFKN